MSRRPKCASTASTLLKTASALLTSHCSAIHLISFSCSDSSRLTRSAAVPSISIQTRLQPARAKAWAVASPRPLPAPVTRATFPFKMLSLIVLLLIYLFRYSLHAACGSEKEGNEVRTPQTPAEYIRSFYELASIGNTG